MCSLSFQRSGTPVSDLDTQGESIVCGQCRRRYPVREGIPIMLKEELRPGFLSGTDWAGAK